MQAWVVPDSSQPWISKVDIGNSNSRRRQNKTSFVVPFGTFRFEVLPFGLAIAPAIFQRTLDIVLSGMKFEFVLVYIDDIIIYSPSFSSHLHHLGRVLRRLRAYDLHVGLNKCSLAQSSVLLLGHEVSASGITPDHHHVSTIQGMPRTIDVHEVKSFVALCSYYRVHVARFANIAEPLLYLMINNASFLWTSQQEQAFLQLKQALTSAPVLAYPDFNKPFLLTTDASDVAIGAVLERVDNFGHAHPIAYFSRSLTSVQRRYSVMEKEGYALVESIRHFKPFLSLGHFLAYTYHQALLALRNPKSKIAEGRIQRWQLFL